MIGQELPANPSCPLETIAIFGRRTASRQTARQLLKRRECLLVGGLKRDNAKILRGCLVDVTAAMQGPGQLEG